MIDIIDGDGAILNTGASDDWIKDGRGVSDPIFGWCSAECVAKFIGCLANAQPEEDITAAINQIYQSTLSKGLS
jgi:hypothetical protein